ncbi:hypothetical protein F8388_023058, partial [Cannabis sativa]
MGHKWVVENQIGKKSLVIDNCKVNNITVDKCTKMGVVFRIVNCNGVEVQCHSNNFSSQYRRLPINLSKDSLGVINNNCQV